MSYNEKLANAKCNLIEEIQKGIVECGGKFVTREELLGYTIEKLLDTFARNGVTIKCEHKPTENSTIHTKTEGEQL